MTDISSYDIEYSGTLEVKSSPIHGNGTFSLVTITSGDLIMSSMGTNSYEVIGHPRSITDPADTEQYLTALHSRLSSVPHPAHHMKKFIPKNEFRFINHSSDNSNVKVLDNLKTYATQNIAIGEELTLNYNDIGHYD
jgi:SET domain-containing protein